MTRNHCNHYIAALLLLMLGTISPVFAQGWSSSINGNVTLSGSAALFPRGTDNRPSIGVQEDTDSGIRFPAAGQVSFVLDGVEKVLFTGNGFLIKTDYLNFGTVAGTTGYGIRNNAGVVEYKNSGGSWGTVISLGTDNTFSGTQTFTLAPVFSSATASRVLAVDGSKLLTTTFASSSLTGSLSDETGTGVAVFGTTPTITTPVFSGTITGTYTLGGTPTFPALSTANYSSTTSAQLLALLSDETGTGVSVFGTSPSLTTPTIAGATLSGSLAGTPTFTGVFANTAFGTHSFSAGGTGDNSLQIRNTTDGASNYASLYLGNSGSATGSGFNYFAPSWTTSGRQVADGLELFVSTAGGMSVAATHASGAIRFYTGGTTERWRVETTGHLVGMATANVIRTNTSDASDNGYVTLTGGGASAEGGSTRGGEIFAYGNENGQTGKVRIYPGNVAGSAFQVLSSDNTFTLLSILGADGSATFTSSKAYSAAGSWNFTASNAAPGGINVGYTTAPNDTGHLFFRAADSGAVRAEIRSNGGIANYSANDVNLSDATTKQIVGLLGSQRESFRRLSFIEGRYLDAPNSALTAMLTAQDVQRVYPDAVTDFANGKLGVREHDIVMRGLKVIQEHDDELARLAAENVALRARLTALEAQ